MSVVIIILFVLLLALLGNQYSIMNRMKNIEQSLQKLQESVEIFVNK